MNARDDFPYLHNLATVAANPELRANAKEALDEIDRLRDDAERSALERHLFATTRENYEMQIKHLRLNLRTGTDGGTPP